MAWNVTASKKTLTTIRSLTNPLDYEGLAASCMQHERLIVSVIDSKLLLGLILHDNTDKKNPNCLELVKIFDPSDLL